MKFFIILSHSYVLFNISVAQLSINGTTVDSVTDRDNEPQYHVKEDAGSITLCIRVESFPEEKDNLTIDYFTSQSTACKYFNIQCNVTDIQCHQYVYRYTHTKYVTLAHLRLMKPIKLHK